MFTTYEESLFWENNRKSIEQKLIPLPATDDVLKNELIQYDINNNKLNLIEKNMMDVMSLSSRLNKMIWKQEDELFYAETLNQSLKDTTLQGEKDLIEAKKYQFKYYTTIIGAGIGGIISVGLTIPFGVGLVTSSALCVGSSVIGGILGYKI